MDWLGQAPQHSADHASPTQAVTDRLERSKSCPKRRFRLILAGTDLAISRCLFDGKPSCWPVIDVTALVTLTINTLSINPALGLILRWIAELVRAAIVRSLYRSSTDISEGR